MSETVKKKSTLKGKDRVITSWLKPCGKPETLATIDDLSVEELIDVIAITDAIKEKATEVLGKQKAEAIKKYKQQQEDLQKKITALENAY